MGKKHLSDVISDEEIRSWKPGDVILISSPTGSGKSTFVLSKLLPKAVEAGKHILYLCNRKILDEQLTVDTEKKLTEFFGERETLQEEQYRALHVLTYQFCENSKKFNRIEIKNDDGTGYVIDETNIEYYVFDEAHYFACDALFNPGTNFWPSRIPTAGINIFLTATPEPLLFFLAFQRREFRFFNQIVNIREKRIERSEKKAELEKGNREQVCVDMIKHGPAKIKKIDPKTKREIADECRKIELYSDCICALTAAQDKVPLRKLPHEEMKPSHEQIDSFYFSEFKELLEIIQTSDEKWIMFVDHKQDGITLQAKLEERGVSCVFLDRQTRNQNRTAKDEFYSIVNHGRYNCSVLISTEVLDCGVSIRDSAVKNIVISQIRKTTFLQMLGRKRMDEGEQIRLYIRAFGPKHISGIRNEIDKKLKFLTEFALLNEYGVKRSRWPTEYSDGMKESNYLNQAEKNAVIEKAFQANNLALTYPVPIKKNNKAWHTIKESDNQMDKVLTERACSETAFVALIYEVSQIEQVLDRYRESEDPCFFLKEQLSWIGHEYDERKWFGYDQRTKNVNDYLMDKCGLKMYAEEQTEFAARCMELLLKLPVPPRKLVQNQSRYLKGDGAVPGKKMLNDAFEEKGIPYRIYSKQGGGANRKSFWYVEAQ